GKPARLPAGAIEVTTRIKTGPGFQQDLLNGVAVAGNAAEHLCVKRRFFRQRVESCRGENLSTQELPALLPLRPGAVGSVAPERDRPEVCIGVRDVDVSGILGRRKLSRKQGREEQAAQKSSRDLHWFYAFFRD